MFIKSILLASASAFAFAGAAAADVSWSGSASAEYNVDPVGVASMTTSASLTASATLAGDWTLSTTLDAFSIDDAVISLTDGTSTLTFGTNHAAGASGISETENADVSISTVIGGVGVSATVDTAGNTEVGASMSAGGADIEVGFVAAGDDAGDFRLGLSTALSGADVAFNVVSDASAATTTWDASLGMALAGADFTFSTASDSTWDLGASYTMGDLTVSAGIDETPGNYTVGVDYAMGAVGLSFSTNQLSQWTASVSYTEGALSVTASTGHTTAMSLDGSYDVGGGVVVYAGMRTVTDAETYAGVEYDLGNGASLALSYSDNGAGVDNVDEDYAKEYAAGTTLSVSFDF